MIKPLNEFVLVQVIKEEDAMKGGVLLPDTHRSTDLGAGKVLAFDSALPLQEGDVVFFDILLLTKVKRGQEELNFIKFSDILGYER